MNFKKGDKVVVVQNDFPVSVGMTGVVDDSLQTTVLVSFGEGFSGLVGYDGKWWMFPECLDFSKEHYLTQFYEEITSAAVAH